MRQASLAASQRLRRSIVWTLFVTCCVVRYAPAAGDESPTKAAKPKPETAELFSAVKDGQIKVDVFAHSHAFLTLRIKNETSEDLFIESKPFGAVPVKLPGKKREGYEDSQSLGSATCPPMKTPSAVRGIKVGAKRTVRVRLPCFCLEFGKPDPHKKIPYALKEIKLINSDPRLQYLLKGFAEGRYKHRPCQLAVWHVGNRVSWRKLSAYLARRSTPRAHRYSQEEIKQAKTIVAGIPSELSQNKVAD